MPENMLKDNIYLYLQSIYIGKTLFTERLVYFTKWTGLCFFKGGLMDKVTKRLFADIHRLEKRIELLEGSVMVSDKTTGLTLEGVPVGLSEINRPGEDWAGANPSQAQASPGCTY